MINFFHKNNRRILSVTVVVLAISLFTWYFFSHINDFRLLLNVGLSYIVLLAAVGVVGIAVNGIFMKWSLLLFDKSIGIAESVRVSLISSAGNFFAPAGSGLGFRALYLKKRHHLAYSDYISIVFCNYILAFLINSILGLCALYSLYPLHGNGGSSLVVLTIVFFVLMLASIGALFIRKSIKPGRQFNNKVLRKIYEVYSRIAFGWKLITSNKKIMLGLLSLTLTNTLLMVLGSYLVMSSIGIHIPLAGLILFSVLGSFSVFVNITPGNLGVKEAIYILFSSVIGLGTTEILSISIVDRTVLFIVLLVLWVFYGRKLHVKTTP